MTAVPLLNRIAGALDSAGISFALIGASALATHGVSRSTLDQDLLVVDERALDTAAWQGLPGPIQMDVRRGEPDDPLAGIVRFTSRGERDVDVVVGRDGWQAAMLQRVVRVAMAGSSLPVVTAADLILLKLFAGGLQDRWDIEQLLHAHAAGTLTADVEHRLPDLPARCRDLWSELRPG